MYLGKDGKFINMCGGLNIVYGTKKIEYENSGQTPDPNVTFQIHELEKQETPLKGDLILNVDGCFYKVDSVSEDGETIETIRLTLQGTGGGGGGTSDGSTSGGSYSVNVPVNYNIFSSEATSMPIEFIAYLKDASDNYINYVSFSLGGSVVDGYPTFYEISDEAFAFNTPHSIDLIDYIDLFGASATSVYINTTDKYGSPRSKRFYIQVVDLSLDIEKPLIFSSSSNKYTYSCKIGGAQSGISSKKLIFNFYDENNLNGKPITFEDEVDRNYVGSWQTELDLTDLNHGNYIMTVEAEAQITGSSTIIPSNILTHKVSKFDENINSALFTALLPERLEQHTNIPLNYLLTSKEENKTYTLKISLDGKEVVKLAIVTNTMSKYPLYFDKKGNYSLTLSVIELGLEWNSNITIVEYTDDLPIIKPDHSSLMLYLTPRGQSNDSITRESWIDYNGLYEAKLNNAYYSDASGWLEDENNIPYLSLNSGSTLTIPSFYPFKDDPTKTSTVNSAMGSGMTIELDFEFNGVTDYNAELIKCISTNERGVISVGFSITGDTAIFYSAEKNGRDENGNFTNENVLSKLNLVEGKRIRLSYVIEPNNTDFPLFLSYLNGKISGVSIYGTGDSFVDSSAIKAQLICNSASAQIKIYGIRFYSTALDDNIILQNYTASLATLEEKQERFDSNNVYTSTGLINYETVSSEGYNLEIPYMTIVGGWKTDSKKNKWKMLSKDLVGQPGLPEDKKDYRMIDVKVTYPKYNELTSKNEYFKGYKDYSYTNTFANGKGMIDNFDSEATNGGCIMYAQGTSSLEYPIKNLRLRWRNSDNYFTVRPNIAPVDIICMKADYMESSGSHNTGAANLIDDLYAGIGLRSPGQEHFEVKNAEGNVTSRIVTCIKGHPCLIFYSPTGEKGTFQYVGKYNLNLDKATPEPFGFNHDNSDFGYLKPGDEYYAIQYKDGSTKFIGQEKPAKGGDYDDTKDGEEKLIVQEGQKINSIHCFEFLDNAKEVCNFLNRPKAYLKNEKGEYIKDENGNFIPDPAGGYYTYEETWYNTFEKDGDEVPGWCIGFESRYPEDRIGYHDADMLYPLASWLNELHYLKTGQPDSDIIPTQEEIDLANQRFKDEYQRYLDKDFLLFYYLVTDTLLMADNRVKNMMIATWGKENREYLDSTGTKHEFYDYVWYPIFYDMDTMLGLDNTGVDRFNYYDEDTNPSVFNGNDVLWNFVRDNLTLELNQMYRDLEQVAFHIDIQKDGSWDPTGLLNYFNKNQANMANEAFYNADAQYKYINPAINGYFDGLHNEPVDPGAAPFLYAAQGDRSLMREYFIVNRIKFLRGKRNSAKFKANDRIDFRWYYPTGLEDEFKGHEKTVEKVKPNVDFEFTSLQTCYAGAVLGANGTPQRERFDGEQTKTIVVEGAKQANGTEAYLLGISNLKDLGDLSKKYPQKFYIMGENKLRTLTLGNPNKYYYNPYWKNAINLSGSTYLQNFNLQNCSTYNFGLDFSSCSIIERILLTGSGTTSIKLPINGLLRELRLPVSVTKLNIDSHQYLTDENFSIGSYDYGTAEEIGKGNGYVNDYGRLRDITIINTPINTYNMLINAISLESYYLQGFTWDISGKTGHDQYVKTKDTSPIENKTYYIWDESQLGYRPALENDIKNSWNIIKEKIVYINNNQIVAIPILDQLMSKSPKKDGIGVTQSSALSGVINITIPAGIKCNQFDLYKKYHMEYPNITINYIPEEGSELLEAYTIEFFNTINITDETEPYFTVLTDGTYTLEDLIYAERGPSATDLALPVLPSTTNTVYNFARKWKDVTVSPNVEYDMDGNFKTEKPKKNMRLEPIFTTATRYYNIKFYDYEGLNPITVKYTYDQIISSHKDTPMYRGRDDSDLNDDERYAFKGWIGEKDFINKEPKPTFIDLTSKKVTYEMSLYPFYEIENATETATDLKYFSFREVRQVKLIKKKYIYPDQGDITEDPEKIILENQYVIDIKEEYRNSISGKITLPSTDSRGRIITAVGNLGESSKITHIFFLPDAEYQLLGGIDSDSSAFNGMTGLKLVHFPENMVSLKYIGDRCFNNNSKLETINNLPDTIEYIGEKGFNWCQLLPIKKLPNNLKYIGEDGFLGCYNLTATMLPHGLTYILPGVFSYCKSLQISHFGNSTNGAKSPIDNNITQIGSESFSLSAHGTQPTAIYLHNSLTYLGNGCFANYGAKDLTIYDDTDILTIDSVLDDYFGDKTFTFNEEYDTHE